MFYTGFRVNVQILLRPSLGYQTHPHRQLLDPRCIPDLRESHLVIVHSALSKIAVYFVEGISFFLDQPLPEILFEVFFLLLSMKLLSLFCILVYHHLMQFLLQNYVSLRVVLILFIKNLK